MFLNMASFLSLISPKESLFHIFYLVLFYHLSYLMFNQPWDRTSGKITYPTSFLYILYIWNMIILSWDKGYTHPMNHKFVSIFYFLHFFFFSIFILVFIENQKKMIKKIHFNLKKKRIKNIWIIQPKIMLLYSNI